MSHRTHCAGALFKPEEVAPEAEGDRPGRRGGASAYKFVSVGSQFKKQLAALMATLATMEPHYVRCIKPNSENSPNLFENVLSLQQVRLWTRVPILSVCARASPALRRASRRCWRPVLLEGTAMRQPCHHALPVTMHSLRAGGVCNTSELH